MPSERILPCPEQGWAHSTCTTAQMNSAMTNSRITAIEADILMGTTNTSVAAFSDKVRTSPPQPIMSHPPDRESDLSFARFMKLATDGGKLRKHVKLDFKEMETTGPCLDILRHLKFDCDGKTIFLNADIIPGPGRTLDDIAVPADIFLDDCQRAITDMKEVGSTMHMATSHAL